ncbi:MAG: Gfo/Idh/MocA family oxidoreductase [Lachnospiraceae bacterium]|nr:Gfo/Idh/MocA family oxidoreductase [Lachnospiraceae bacterium]
MIRIGAVGTSFIMDTILENVAAIENISCEAIYSRSPQNGRKLADKFQIPKLYTNYETMLADKSLDLIYIASPNSLHYEQSKAALLAKKSVLCEKPFTVTGAQLRELIFLAKNHKLFLFEAILPMFHPNYKIIREKLSAIGKPKMAQGVFCQYSSRYDALLRGEVPNVFNPAFAGGALMDLNMYNVYFLVGLFGKPSSVTYEATLFDNGIDTNGILTMRYPDFTCQCVAAKDTFCENSMQILGEKGYIKVTPAASNVQQVKIVRRGEEEITFKAPENPWYYEFEALEKLLSEKNYEECYHRLEVSLQVVDVLETARKSAGLTF